MSIQSTLPDVLRRNPLPLHVFTLQTQILQLQINWKGGPHNDKSEYKDLSTIDRVNSSRNDKAREVVPIISTAV